MNWIRHWREDSGAEVLTQADDAREPNEEWRKATRWFHGVRQVVETVNNWLIDRFGLKRPCAHTSWGVLTWVAAKVAAFNLGVYLNHVFGVQRLPFSTRSSSWSIHIKRLWAQLDVRWWKLTRPTPPKTCSGCRHIFEGFTLKDCWVDCRCGVSLDRDHNAAINIVKRAGHVRWGTSSSMHGLPQEAVGL